MFDANRFKKSVKEWMRAHPDGTEADLADYCEELIPPAQFTANQWLVEQTVSWYRYVLAQRRREYDGTDFEDEEASV
ncbi:MAG: hypothetical protein FJ146_10250 [Deltaproteobacteria bacterium]|nr:hypothetical protein [Deltaproteobacteria bacterium]